MWRKRKAPALVWEYKLVQPLWKAVWKFLKKLKGESPYDLQSHSWGYTWTTLYMHPSVPSSTVYTNQDMETTSTSIDRGARKTWYTHTMEYYSARKRTN